MKAVILAGGKGTRISEESMSRPKPMIEIGSKPILWHIMKILSAHGVQDFVICLGYKGYVIKEYFANYFLHASDVTFEIANQRMNVHQNNAEPWRVTLVDTGDETMTGGRLKRVKRFIEGESEFCFTYGDGVGDIDLTSVLKVHRERRLLATVTATQMPGRFGSLDLNDQGKVVGFREKPHGDGGWINGGFFILNPKALEYVDGDTTVWEDGPLQKLAGDGQLAAYFHRGFWQPMDTVRDRIRLQELWESGRAPWKIWE